MSILKKPTGVKKVVEGMKKERSLTWGKWCSADPCRSITVTKQEKLRIINEMSGMWFKKDTSYFDVRKEK